MKIKTIIILTISFLIIISFFFIFQNQVLAISAPTVTFVGGDDVLQNGGTDDAYDSLIIFQLSTTEPGLSGWEMDYSNNGGETWNTIAATYELATDRYYWSTSKIYYAPTLLFRARSVHGSEYSEYAYATLALSHRQTNNLAHYFIEDFTTSKYFGSQSRINWDTILANLMLAQQVPGKYYLNGQAASSNLLRGLGNDVVTRVIFQPVQADFSQTLRYQFSNNGTTWYGPGVGQWLSFPNQIVPAAVEIAFTSSSGTALYWRVDVSSSNHQITPYVYQLRIDWQENYAPQACFTITPPVNSTDPEHEFSFDARCSSDYEDSLTELFYRWDFDNNGTWEIEQPGTLGYLATWNFHSTSTQTIVLEVEDSYGATDSFTGQVNTGGVSSSIYGWAWSSNYGWTSLNCENIYYGINYNLCPPDYGLTMHPEGTITGWAWDPNIGWLCFGSTCDYLSYGYPPSPPNPPNTEAIAVYDSTTGEISGWAKYLVYGDTSEDGWLYLRGNWCDAIPGQDQCVYIDLASHRIYGYAWNGFVTDLGIPRGVGWVEFAGNVNVPWLETKYGQIYGRSNVGTSQTFGAPDERYNATYCIRSGPLGEIVNFTSEAGCEESHYSDLNFPSSSNQYHTILGVIDFERILGAYEVEELNSNDIDQSLGDSPTLGNKVYHFTGFSDYYLSAPLTFYNARNFDSSGAGTIIVEGNLHLNQNLYYENSPVTSQIENLAAVSWIIKGDLDIAPTVSHLVGNFIVLGIEPAVMCNEPGGTGCGEFHSGNDSDNPLQLVVSGLVMARKFYLERYFKEANEPAEKIIYDGRVMSNAPPGLENVAKGLPVWREAIASEIIE